MEPAPFSRGRVALLVVIVGAGLLAALYLGASSAAAGAGSGSTPPPTPTDHEDFSYQTVVSIRVARSPLRLKGRVQSVADCTADREVVVWRRRKGPDLWVGDTTTTDGGRWRFRLDARRGRYYAVATRIEVPSGVCRRDRSETVRI